MSLRYDFKSFILWFFISVIYNVKIYKYIKKSHFSWHLNYLLPKCVFEVFSSLMSPLIQFDNLFTVIFTNRHLHKYSNTFPECIWTKGKQFFRLSQTSELPCILVSTRSDTPSTSGSCRSCECTPCACILHHALLVCDTWDRVWW